MESATEPQAVKALGDLARRVAAYEGEAAALGLRAKALETEVGLAKGRLALKPKVDQFLEELQAEAHARRVGDFEKLLTALVSEVLPKEAPIGMELEIERGQPSLDIVSRHSADRVEDIYDDQGGALTNVVSMGLRMIAVVRSGMNRFLMLDESDCWISNSRVPAFYSVLKDAARKIDVQCFAVSHHDIAAFGEGINTAGLSGHPEMAGGVRIENNPRPYRWKDDEKGIRWIRLRNFQGYVDETFHLSPGVNALTGENNIGKSSFVRAFRAVFYGEARDSLIRRGERQCAVEIGFSHGRVLRWDRQIRRNPVNCWKYLGPDGAVVTEDGMTYETGGRTVPDWVTDLFRIGPVEGLDVHAIKQKTPVFLLDKPGSTRAAVLSVGQESGHIRRMVALHKERCARDSAKAKEGEMEMSAILKRIEALKGLDDVRETMARAEAIASEMQTTAGANVALETALASVVAARETHAAAARRASVLTKLPGNQSLRDLATQASATAAMEEAAARIAVAVADLVRRRAAKETLSKLPSEAAALADTDGLENAAAEIARSSNVLSKTRAMAAALRHLPASSPGIVKSDETIKVGKAVKDARMALATVEARQRVFATLPADMPALIEAAQTGEALDAIMGSSSRLVAAGNASKAAERELAACETELESLVEEMGHSCPLCNSPVEGPEAFLQGRHVHAMEAVNG